MDVIETADVELAAYAVACGASLSRVPGSHRPLFRLEGAGLQEVEIDFAHFGPKGVSRDRLERLASMLRSALGRL